MADSSSSSSAAAAAAPAPAPSADLLAKIKKQVEFYFSDSNFRKDKFLREKANADPDGFVPITVLLTFNRLKSLTMGALLVSWCSGAALHCAVLCCVVL